MLNIKEKSTLFLAIFISFFSITVYAQQLPIPFIQESGIGEQGSNLIEPVKSDISLNAIKDFSYSISDATYEIKTRSAAFVPVPTNKKEIGYLLENYENEYYLVQFYVPDTTDAARDIKNELNKDGIRIMSKYQGSAYVAKVPDNLFAQKTYPGIRWIGTIKKEDKISLKELNKIKNHGHEKFVVSVLESITEKNLGAIQKTGAKIISYEKNMLSIEADYEEINEVLELPFVFYAEKQTEIKTALDASSKIILSSYTSSIDASSVTVGVIDSGIIHSHPHFQNTVIYDGYDFVDGDSYPEAVCGEWNCSNGRDNNGNNIADDGAHGVNVAGVISGTGVYQGRFLNSVSGNSALTVVRAIKTDGTMANGINPEYGTIWRINNTMINGISTNPLYHYYTPSVFFEDDKLRMILTSVRYQGTTITKIEGYTYFEHSYPDILLDIGNDGSVEWSSDGEIINETETEDFSSAINQFLVSCSTNSEGYCILPIKITSVTAGQLFVYGLDIKFETISYLWKTENIPSGLHYRVRIAAHDDFLSSESDESEDFTISHGGKPPLPYTLEGQQTD